MTPLKITFLINRDNHCACVANLFLWLLHAANVESVMALPFLPGNLFDKNVRTLLLL